MQDYIFQIRKELRGLQLVRAFVTICDAECVASPATTYKALDPSGFNQRSPQHRAIIRRAIRFLHTQGSLPDWDADEICPESLAVPVQA